MLQRSTSVLALALVAFAGLVLGSWLFLSRENDSTARAPIEVGVAPTPESPATPAEALAQPAGEPAKESPAPDVEPVEPVGERSSVEAIDERELTDAVWLEGRVRLPDGTPPNEEVEIVADGKNFKKFTSHRARVQPDGSFRVAFHKDTRNGYLKLDAPHLYLEPPLRVKLSAPPKEILLEPVLGGLIEGTLVPPKGAPGPARVVEGKFVQCWGFSMSGGEAMRRSGKIDKDLRFQLRGVPPRVEAHLSCDLGVWPSVDENVSKLEPGETRQVELEFRRGARLAGRVQDEQGAALSPATVGAQITSSSNDGWRESRPGKVEKDGSFVVEGIEPGPMKLVATCDGYVEREIDLGELRDGDERTEVVVAMSAGNCVAGQVTWPDGSPVAGASVWIEAPEADEDRAMYAFGRAAPKKAGPDGRFRVTGLGPGPFEVRAEGKRDQDPDEAGEDKGKAIEASAIQKKLAKSKAPTWRAKLVNVPPNSESLALALQQGFVLTGRVTDDTGKPPARFSVTANRSGQRFPFGNGEGALTQKFDDKDGAFELEGLSAGEWSVTAFASGTTKNAPIELTLPDDGVPLSIVLLRTSTISGIVIGTDGQPAARAMVAASREGQDERMVFESADRSTKADSKGQFKLKNAPAGSITLTATLAGSAPSAPFVLEVPPGSEVGPVSLQLRRGSRLSGEVLGAPGHTLSGREVSLWGQQGGSNDSATTDERGQFHFDGLLPGSYQVSAEASREELEKARSEDGEQDWSKEWSLRKTARVEIKDGEDAHVVLGAPPRAPVEISGTVRRGTTPVAGVQVSAHGRNGQQQRSDNTNAAGRYSFTLDEPGEYSFSVQSPSGGTHRSFQRTIPEVSAHTLDFEMTSGRIAGRVLGPDGQAFEGAHLWLQLELPLAEQRPDGMYGWTESKGDGSFSFEDLPAGTYRVSANDSNGWGRRSRASGVRIGERRGLVLAEGATIENVVLELAATGSIEGVVTDTSGAPVEHAWVSARDAAGNLDPERSTNTDENGRYEFHGVSPGAWTVSARAGRSVSDESARLDVSADSTARANLVLRPGTTLRVKVLDSSGKDVGASITVADSLGRDVAAGARFDADEPTEGHRVGPLAPGHYTVTAANHDGARASTTVDVNGEEERDVQLQLGGG